MLGAVRGPRGLTGATGATGATGPNYPGPKTYFVDKNRVDSYTPDGTFYKPYLSIMAARNAMKAAGTNTVGAPEVIDVIGPGNYIENVDFNDAAFKGIILRGYYGCTITPASGDALNITSNNDNLGFFNCHGVRFGKQVNIVGANNNGNTFVSDAALLECLFTSSVIFKNVQSLAVYESQFNGNGTIENIPSISVGGGSGIAPTTAWTVTWNASNNIPSGAGQCVLNIDRTIGGADFTVSNGSLLQFRSGSRIGYPGGSIVIQSGGQVINYGGQIRSDISGAGTYTDRGGWYLGTNTVTTKTNEKPSSQVAYTAGTSSNWATSAPTDVKAALDRMATLLKTLNGGTAIP